MLKGRLIHRPIGAFVRRQCTAPSSSVKLINRSVIRLAGQDTKDFLQGLITNDVMHLGGQGTSIYSLFLNKAGRVLYDVFLHGSENPDEIFIDCDSEVGQELRKHMMIYRIRRKISIDLVNDEYNIWATFGGESNEKLNSSDPRVKELGARLLKRNGEEDGLTEVPINEYNMHRYLFGVAEGIKEIVPGKAFPLEVNCDYMHGLSVHKGCYLGQEFTARTYHTGVVRKRIMPVQLKSSAVKLTQRESDELIGREIETQEGKAGGKLRALEGEVGIGLLRIESVLATERLSVNKSVEVTTWKPNWWPIVAAKGVD